METDGTAAEELGGGSRDKWHGETCAPGLIALQTAFRHPKETVAAMDATPAPFKDGIAAARADIVAVRKWVRNWRVWLPLLAAFINARGKTRLVVWKARTRAARWLAAPVCKLAIDIPAGYMVCDVVNALAALNRRASGAWSMTWTGNPGGSVEVHLLHVGLFVDGWKGPGFRMPPRKAREEPKPRVICKLVYIGKPEGVAEFILRAPAAEAEEMKKQEGI